MENDRNVMDPIPGIATVKGMNALELAKTVAAVLDAKKAFDVQVFELREPADLADCLVLATGTSRTHVQSLAGDVEYWIGVKGENPQHTEGRNGGNWTVLDYGTVMVHVMSRETRSFYNLENLYADAKCIRYGTDNEEK